MKNFWGEEIEKVVFISEEQLNDTSSRILYGKYFEDTAIFNIYPELLNRHGNELCRVEENAEVCEKVGFDAVAKNGKLEFFYDGKKLKVESYGLYQSIFSRNKGILETGVMGSKYVVVLGCGSVGSLAAMELARAGVGHFLLVDPDIIEYHNICRHQCGIDDVGDLKINALERKLLNINPFIEVKKFEGIIQNIPKQILDEFCHGSDTIFIGCADNRLADVYSNRISIYYGAAFLSVGFWERAYAGEIFYYIPGKNMPCYGCAIGAGDGVSTRAEANHHVYSNQENIEGLKFEPGISIDINFITTVGVKLCIDILNAGRSDYKPRLLNYLKQYTIICNTNDAEIGGEMVDIFTYPLQISSSLLVSFNKKECCNLGCCKYDAARQNEKEE